MLIALIRPYTVTSSDATGQDAAPPLGVAYLAASLLKAGCNVIVIDAVGEAINSYGPVPGFPKTLRHGLTDEEIINRIPADVDVICVSCMYSLEWTFNRELINRINAAFPAKPIVVGGEHVTACPEFVLHDCPSVRACCLGEGEETLVELVRALALQRSSANDHDDDYDLAHIRGIVFRLKDGSTRRTDGRPRIRNVTTIPRPAWHLIPIHAYLDHGVMTGVDIGRSMPILASRGCPYECTFCSSPTMWGNAWKAREPEDVVDEILSYKAAYGATNFDLHDLTAIVRRDWIVRFCSLLIEQSCNITWQLPTGTRSEVIDEEVCSLLYRSGCRYINYAPESGSDRVIALMKKKVNKALMLRSMHAAVRSGLKVKANFMIGIPGESYEDVVETYAYILRLALIGVHDVSVFPFNPYPGSEIFTQLETEGKVRMGDQYFCNLSQCTDPLYPHKSYSPFISDTALRILTLSGMAMFYWASFVLHPLRLLQLAANVSLGKPKTKLETSLERVWTRRRLLGNQTG